MTLRVTHVLRRIDGEWRLVHRHADFPPPTSAGSERGQGADPNLTVTLAAPPATVAPVR